MPALIIILSILAFITLVLIIPMVIKVSYAENQNVIVVQYLFLKFQLYPRVPKKKKEGKPSRKRKITRAETKEKQPKKSFFETLGYVVEVVKLATGGTRFVFRRLVFYKIYLHIDVGSEDAAQTAIEYGKISAYVYSAYAVLSNVVRFKQVHIEINPSYDKTETEVSFKGRVRVRPSAILAGVIGILYQFLVNTLINQNNVRSGGYNGRSSNTRTYEYNHAKNQGND